MNVTAKPQRVNTRQSRRRTQKPKKAKASTGAFVSTAKVQRTTAPRITNSGKSRRIVHRELVQSVLGSVAFTATKLPLNPGSSTTFPWLSSQADGWEQYRFNKLAFEYFTRTSTATLGSVILAPDYDASDRAPPTEAAVTSYMDCVEDAPWKDIKCQLNTTSMFPMGPRKYVRTAEVPGSKKVYDAGNLWLCTVEEVGTDAIGKLWVEYDVELFIPQTVNSAGQAESSSVYSITTAGQTLATGVAEPVEWETVDDGLGFGVFATGVVAPPKGKYLMWGHLTCQDTSAEQLALTIYPFKNGAGLPPPGSMGSACVLTLPANGYVCVPFHFCVDCNGTDTFQLQVTATGAAGTLALVDERSVLFVQAA
jgi:hypothetical protein